MLKFIWRELVNHYIVGEAKYRSTKIKQRKTKQQRKSVGLFRFKFVNINLFLSGKSPMMTLLVIKLI